METLTKVQQQLYEWLVDYIRENQHSPSIRQMMKAMGLKSPAPIQSRLEHLRSKGYIDWTEGKARTIRLLHSTERGIPIMGEVFAGQVREPVTDAAEFLDIAGIQLRPGDYALRVNGDSMIEAMIADGDLVIMRPAPEQDRVKNGTIVAARVEGSGNTLKYFHRRGSKVTLKPGNPSYEPIEAPASEVDIQGVLVGVWRGLVTASR
ncbi:MULTISPECIES: transcriptional repressor LexA [unclassified Leptolyngbya]|uniref:transcriptional repressor LexA n=1 Tax=unclassified Leptolyngbya TaxID=2650499 RepID=UPI001682FDC4|nr:MULTISPECIES: transcriptional repressor LexA [unclassified Leptolyngbya]MBD1912240.1 repressor LexA [Leptolyngbya sp. FACHB-8]MBD2155131.1 repressor LexA [Leptolyngbya sp. FACHB-16]